MQITAVGPNLPSSLQRKGEFHVHATGCMDLRRGALRDLDQTYTFNASSVEDVVKMVTEKQIAFITSLLREREMDVFDVETFTRKDASALIETLLATPSRVKAPKATEVPGVEAGRYAIERDGVLKFYRVDRPTEGRWAGYTFVHVYASDETYPIRDRASRTSILEQIADDPDAMARYGRELGVCGKCGRTLTDETSRALGIGPVCRESA